MDVLVTYDIADTENTGAARLRRIADVCEKYGQRVQFSVFECRLSKARLARLVGEVEDIIDPSGPSSLRLAHLLGCRQTPAFVERVRANEQTSQDRRCRRSSDSGLR